MTRKKLAEIPSTFHPDEAEGERKTQTFTFDLTTPMFGGATESWKLDLTSPVRAQGVKGQLRFWWRTTRDEATPDALREKENQLWGGKSGERHLQSKVAIAIQQPHAEHTVQARMENLYAVKGDVIPKYVLFPITDKVKNDEDIQFVTQHQFTMTVTYPADRQEELLDTLKLWCLFGGVGARNRRGAGSIHCPELMAQFKTPDDIRAFVRRFGCQPNNERHDGRYPRLRGARLALSKPLSGKNDSAAAWRRFLERYADFRQGPGCGRKAGNPRPGRSYWPEPDAIRSITGQHAPNHQPEHPDPPGFPRAAYGLPIITKFITNGDPGHPRQLNLEPGNDRGERWPSPVILKVIKLDHNQIIECCLVLNAAPPEKIVLKGGDGHRANLPHQLRSDQMPQAFQGGKRQMKTNDPLRPGENPYQALIRFLNLEVGI